jgi:hypothetical protein
MFCAHFSTLAIRACSRPSGCGPHGVILYLRKSRLQSSNHNLSTEEVLQLLVNSIKRLSHNLQLEDNYQITSYPIGPIT